MALTDAFVRSLKPGEKTYKKFDDGGLYMEVTPTGYKSWKMKFSVKRLVNGKMKTVSDKITFGQYPALGLRDARIKRDETRRLLDDGVDPKYQAQVDQLESVRNTITFDEVGEKFWNEWRKDKAHTTIKNKNVR